MFTVCRPTLFYCCRPYHFFSKNKKKRDCCPTLLERSRVLVLVFKFFADLFYLVCSQTFYGYLRILSIQDGDVLVAFHFKNVITKIRKACSKQQVITRCLEIFNDNYPCDGVFLLWVYFPLLLLDVVNRGLELSEES